MQLPADWIESTPEWKACFGLIDSEEYLRLTGDCGRVITAEHRAKLVNRNGPQPGKSKDES